MPATNASFAARPSRHVDQLHVHRGGVGVPGALGVDQQLLDDAGQELDARLPLPGADEGGAADLVEHRRGALLVRGVDDVGLQGVDGRQLGFRPLKPELTGIVGRGDRRGVGHVERGQAGSDDTTGGRRESGQEVSGVDHGVAHSQIGGAGGVAEDQGIVVCLGEQEVAAVRAPARRVRQRVLRESREQAQALSHAAQLAVLLPLRIEQELLDDRRDGVPGRHRGVVDADLRRTLDRESGAQSESEQDAAHGDLLSRIVP